LSVYEGTYYDPNRWGEVRVEACGDTLWATFPDLNPSWSGQFTHGVRDGFAINPGGLGSFQALF